MAGPAQVCHAQAGGRPGHLGHGQGATESRSTHTGCVQQEGGRHWGLEGGEPSWRREEEAQTGDAGGQAFKTGRTLSP